jgi:hypothetical protein
MKRALRKLDDAYEARPNASMIGIAGVACIAISANAHSVPDPA